MNNKKDDLLKLSNINKFFQEKTEKIQVLENISFSLKRGEIIALVGPSGCGKTTLLNIVAGLLEAEQGKVERKDGTKIGYVFQEPRLLPWMSVEENISFIQNNFLADKEAKEQRETLLQGGNLMDYRSLYPGQISGGMKQSLELIRALAIKPDLLFLDEPFKSLDIALKYQLQELLLEQYSKNKFGMLFITHDPEDAVLLADRVFLLTKKPSTINKIFDIKVDREDRNLKNERIYNILQEILEIIIS